MSRPRRTVASIHHAPGAPPRLVGGPRRDRPVVPASTQGLGGHQGGPEGDAEAPRPPKRVLPAQPPAPLCPTLATFPGLRGGQTPLLSSLWMKEAWPALSGPSDTSPVPLPWVSRPEGRVGGGAAGKGSGRGRHCRAPGSLPPCTQGRGIGAQTNEAQRLVGPAPSRQLHASVHKPKGSLLPPGSPHPLGAPAPAQPRPCVPLLDPGPPAHPTRHSRPSFCGR